MQAFRNDPTIPPIAAAKTERIASLIPPASADSTISQRTWRRNFCASWIRAVEPEPTIKSISAAPGGKAAAFSKESDGLHLAAARFLDCGQDIARLSAGREGDQHIAGLCECPHLPRKDVLKAIIVSDGREKSAIRAQGDCRIRTPIFLEAAGEFRRDVGAVGRASAVSAYEQLATALQAVTNQSPPLRIKSPSRARRVSKVSRASLSED